MGHTSENRNELLARVRRIGGQVKSVERALLEEQECSKVLQQVSAIRGAINGLMVEILEDEMKLHILSPSARANSDQARAADELIEVLRTYLK